MTTDRTRLFSLLGVLGLLVLIGSVIWWPGCRKYPEVSSRESLDAMRALYTACSSKSEERLTKVEQRVKELASSGQLTEKEQTTFHRIISQARGGDWDGAAKESYRFAQDQIR